MAKKTTYESPLEAEFDIPAGTTILPKYIGNEMVDQQTGEILPAQSIEDDADTAAMETGIIQNIDDVYDSAMAVFDTQSSLIETVDPKFAARNAEVANAYLNTALAAMKLKREMLGDKRKGKSSTSQTAGTINNNVIVADRNDILRMLQQNKEKK